MTEDEAIKRIRERDAQLAEARKHLRLVTEGEGFKPPVRLADFDWSLPEPTPEELEAAEARQKADAAKRARLEEQQERQRQAAALSKLPPNLAETLRGELHQTQASIAALEWERGSGRVLLLRGGVGVGKSVAAAMVAQASALRYRDSISWHRPADFASAVLHSYSDDAPKLGRDLVVVDDLGRETRTDVGEALCALIDDTATRMVLTTNLSREEFRERYDVRLIDRLGEVGTAITLKGESRRKKGGAF